MHKVINCIKEHNPVINKKLKKVTIEEGNKIATELFKILAKRKDGIGLAANQVGIDAAVAVVNVKEPIVLINPEVVSTSVEVPYYEGCLSFKGKGVHTKRYRDVIITTEQLESQLYFSGAENKIEGKGSWEKEQSNKHDAELRLLESVCVQHEIDHLNGMTIHDRKRETTVKVEKKIGRNQKVLIACGSDSKVVKYKKAIPLLENGWTLVESK